VAPGSVLFLLLDKALCITTPRFLLCYVLWAPYAPTSHGCAQLDHGA